MAATEVVLDNIKEESNQYLMLRVSELECVNN